MRIVWIVQGHRSGARNQGLLLGKYIEETVLLAGEPLGIDHEKPVVKDEAGIHHATGSLDAAVRQLAPDVVVLSANGEQVRAEAGRIHQHTPVVLRIGLNSLEWVMSGLEHAASIPSAVRLVQACDHVVTQTDATRRDLESFGLDADRISVVPNAIPMPDESVHSPDPNAPPIAGQLSAQISPLKNQHTTVKAIGHIRNRDPTHHVGAIIAGRRTHFTSAFEQQVGQMRLPDGVQFVGYLDDPDEAFWPEVGVHVCPSFSETQPNVVLEAARMGVPSILADAGWAEAFPDSFPRCHPDDPAAWGAVVDEYLKDDGLRTRTAASQQAFVREHYALEVVAPQYVDVLERVVDRVDPFGFDGGVLA